MTEISMMIGTLIDNINLSLFLCFIFYLDAYLSLWYVLPAQDDILLIIYRVAAQKHCICLFLSLLLDLIGRSELA